MLDDIAYPAGSWIFPAQAGIREALREVADRQGLEFTGAAAALPQVPTHLAKVPRLGLWVPWADTDSIGWVRYTLDQRKIPYIYLRDEDIRAGGLQKKIDVLLYGHVDLELAEQIHGIPKEWGPMPFKRTAKTPSHGTPAASDDITGGIGWEGLDQIQQFLQQLQPAVPGHEPRRSAHAVEHHHQLAGDPPRLAGRRCGNGLARRNFYGFPPQGNILCNSRSLSKN